MQDYSLGLIVPAVLTVCEDNANGVIMGEGGEDKADSDRFKCGIQIV